MDLNDFERLLDLHGSNWKMWPEQARRHAQLLVRDHEDAKILYSQATEIDASLRLEPPLAPKRLRRRILNQTINRLPSSESWIETFLTHLWRPVAVAFLPLCLGLAVGFFDQDPINDLEEEIVALTFTEFETLTGDFIEP